MAYESSPRRIERARKALARDKGVDPDDLKYIGDQEGAHAGQLGTHLFNIMDPGHPNYKSTVGWPMERTIETTQGDIMSIWTEVEARGIPYDTHESDLYIPVNDETRALVRGSGLKYTAFFSSTDHKMWYDIPFAYEPWWEKRTGNRMRGNPGKRGIGHTPGPWEAREHHDDSHWFVDHQQGGEGYTLVDELNEGDAKLIASAPGMLTTLREILRDIIICEEGLEEACLGVIITRVKRAILKAEGR